MTAVARVTASGDLRRSDVALGVLVAALTVGGTAAGVASGEIETAPLLAEGEIAVPIRPVFEPQPPRETPPPRPPSASPVVPAPPEDPSPPPDAAPLGSPSSKPAVVTEPADPSLPAVGAVPPRPVDAPRPTGTLPPRPKGGIKALPRLSNPDAPALPGIATEPGFGPGGPGVAPGSAEPEDSPDDPYAYVDPSLEDPTADPGAPGVVGGTEPAPDPAAEHAIAIFRQRLQRWISVHFVVSGAGLTAEERDGATVRAVLVLDEDRRLVDYSVDASGHPALRSAAGDALQILLGTRAPEPPEHYPGPVQRRIRVTFRCTESTCD